MTRGFVARVAATPAQFRPVADTKIWNLDDPAGKELADVRPIRDEIERRVRLLLDDLRISYRS